MYTAKLKTKKKKIIYLDTGCHPYHSLQKQKSQMSLGLAKYLEHKWSGKEYPHLASVPQL